MSTTQRTYSVMQDWYRTGTKGNQTARYHLPDVDWVHTGLSVCGAQIKQPSFVCTVAPHCLPERACQHCIDTVNRTQERSR